MRAVQRLADIDVAEPRNHALVQQRRLQAGLLAGAGSRQHPRIEFVAERFGAETSEQRPIIESLAGKDLHVAKAARSTEDNSRARRQVEYHTDTRAISPARMANFARRRLI